MRKQLPYKELGPQAIIPPGRGPRAWGDLFDVLFADDPPAPPFTVEGTAAVVTVRGPLAQRACWWWDSYEQIKPRVAAALASEAPRVILDIDSPGGEAMGCFELARELRAMAAAAGKELIAFTSGYLASAAYALATAASRIVSTPTAYVGSIGCCQPLVDLTAQDRAYGVAYTWLTTGERKLDGNPHVGTSESAITEVRGQLEQLGAMFFALVEDHRGIPAAKTKALDGALVIGIKALGVGLVDQVSTWSDLIAGAVDGTPPTETATMSKYDEAMGALKAAADGDDEDAKKAKKAIKCIEDGEKPADDKEKKDGAEGASEGEKPADDKEKEKKDADAKAAAARRAGASPVAASSTSSDPVILALAQEVQELKAERAAEVEAKERATLLATRPDFTGAVLTTLQKAPMADLKEAVEKWPKIASREAALAAAAGATRAGTGLQGNSGEASTLSPDEAKDLDCRMGLAPISGTVKREGRSMTFEVMTPAAAKAHLAKLNAAPTAATAAPEGR